MPDDPSAFDPADLFGDDAGAGRDFTRSVEDFFRSGDGPDPEARKRGLLEKYKAAKAAARAGRRSAPAPADPPASPPSGLPPLPSLPPRPVSLPPLPPLSSGLGFPASSRGLPPSAPGKGNDA